MDGYEKELEQSLNNENWKSSKDKDKIIAKAQKTAEGFFKKDKRINVRLTTHQLESIKMEAAREGLPYQTLISSILHKYTTGQLHG